MLKLNGCPKCGGSVLIDRDQYGWYEKCLNCGYERDVPQVVKARKSVNAETRKTGSG